MTAQHLDRYGVMGNPIDHSQSPRIHRLFAAQTQQALEYNAISVAPGELAAAVDGFRRDGGRGLNITLPFKRDAWVYADILSARAERAGAVNTLVFRDNGEALGDNTDGLGLVRDLVENHGLMLADKRILLVGAGGAARGVIGLLLDKKPAKLIIANRTSGKAVELAMLFNRLGPVSGYSLDALQGFRFDLIINATAASLEGEMPPLPAGLVAEGGWCYDMMYGSTLSPFMSWGLAQGALQAVDGLGMLVEQAAESFWLWRGIRPDTAAVIAELRRSLSDDCITHGAQLEP